MDGQETQEGEHKEQKEWETWAPVAFAAGLALHLHLHAFGRRGSMAASMKPTMRSEACRRCQAPGAEVRRCRTHPADDLERDGLET